MRTLIFSIYYFLVLLFGQALSWAHEGPLDELGCHTDAVNSSYHCVTGPLTGLEFSSKEEAEAALKKRGGSPAAAPADSGAAEEPEGFQVSTRKSQQSAGGAEEPRDRIMVISWKLKKGVTQPDYDRIAGALASAHLAVFRDVEFNERGETPLNVLASVMEKRMSETICRGWVKNARGERGRFAFIWLDRLISHIDSDGQLREGCGSRPVVFRTEAKSSALVTFFFKPNHKLFQVLAVEADKPLRDNEVPALFRPFVDTGWPILVAGDVKVSPKSKGYNDPRKWSFKPALSTDHDNAWLKNLSLVEAGRVSLRNLYPELNTHELGDLCAASSPLRMDLSFSEEEAVEAQMVNRSARASKKSAPSAAASALPPSKGPAYPATGTAELSDLREDLESEAGAIEEDSGETAKAKAKSKPKAAAKPKKRAKK